MKVRQFRERLKVPKDENGEVCGVPMVQIYSNCRQFTRTIPALVLSKTKVEDVDTDGEDHIYDEACHIFMAKRFRAGFFGECDLT